MHNFSGLPKFDDQPSGELTVFEDERARFACSIDSNPPAKITWFKNGHNLPMDSRMTLLPSGIFICF